MLELDDIQHLLLTRAPALTARYEFLSFRDEAGGRAWVSAIEKGRFTPQYRCVTASIRTSAG